MLPRSLKLSVDISKHGKRWVAYSPALDISTSGISKRDAQKKFEVLVELFFEELEAMGTTTDVLKELGWKKVRSRMTPPTISQTSVKVKIPSLA